MNIRFLTLIAAASSLVASAGCGGSGGDQDVSSVAQAQNAVDATCVATITMSFDPPVSQPIPPSTGPQTIVAGTGTVPLCTVTDNGATSGTVEYSIGGNLTCTSSQNADGTIHFSWADGLHSAGHVSELLDNGPGAGGAAALQATIDEGRFAGDTLVIANLRNPSALLTCLTCGLDETSGTTSLTFTHP